MKVSFLLSVLLALAIPAAAAKAPVRNVVLILADDLGEECLSCYGSKTFHTPNIDALAQSGIRFDTCYATPLCTPSRVELMTGKYGYHTGWTQMIGNGMPEMYPPSLQTFGHLFRNAGFHTALAGKWQLADLRKHPNHVKECGFDEYSCWNWDPTDHAVSRYWSPEIWENGRKREHTGKQYGEDLFCEFLIDFIRRHQNEPFFVYYPMALVHEPFIPPPNAVSESTAKGSINHYPSMVEYMDTVVGRMVHALDEMHLSENTLLIFTGDNGSNARLVLELGPNVFHGGKGSVTENGVQVPLIARCPGTIPVRTCNDLVDFSDFVPTLLEMTGLQAPAGFKVDGRSFAPQLLGKKGKPRDWIYSQLGPRRLVRDSQWLLHDDGRFYQIDADPLEYFDASDTTLPEGKRALSRLKTVLQESIDDTATRDTPHPKNPENASHQTVNHESGTKNQELPIPPIGESIRV